MWIWAATQTGGGWIYSLRLLAPAVAVAAVLCGWIVHTRPLVRGLIGLAFVVASAEAAHRAWSLPVRPLAAEWPWDFSDWAETRRRMDATTEKAVWPILVREAGTHAIVVEHTLHHPLVWAAGGRPVPLMSPVLAPTLGPDRRFTQVLRALATANIRFIVIDREKATVRALGECYPFWRELADCPPTVNAGALLIYDLHALNVALAEERL